MEAQQLSRQGRQLFGRIEFDEREQLICEMRRHPAGLYLIYMTGLLIAAVLAAVLIILPAVLTPEAAAGLDISLSSWRPIMVIAGLILIGLTVIGTAIAGYLYGSNVIIVTSDKVAQVICTSLFDRKVSQLSIGDVQDVTVDQRGIMAHIFNYGTIVIETAGEQQNYTFAFAPNPYTVAKAIVGAHEENLKLYGN